MLRLTTDAHAVLDPGPFVPCAQLCSKAQAAGVGEELGREDVRVWLSCRAWLRCPGSAWLTGSHANTVENVIPYSLDLCVECVSVFRK